MACDGTRAFVLGGQLTQEQEADGAKPIYVLDTKHLNCPEPNSDIINPSEKTAEPMGKSSASLPTRGQPHQSSSSSNAHPAHRASPFQKEELDYPTFQHVTRERNPILNGLPSLLGDVSGRPGHVPEEDDDSEGSTEHKANPVAPDEKETARLENRRLIELERQLSKMVVAQVEQDRRIGQLTDELAQARQAAEEKDHAGQELHKLQAQLNESLLSRDHALEQARQAKASAAEEKRCAALELRELQEKLDGLLLSRDQAEANAADAMQCAALEQRELQAKLGELLMSRDKHLRMLEQAQTALQKATSRAAYADERSQPACEHETELAELRAELEGKKSELAAVRFRLTEAKNGWAKGKAKEDNLHSTVTAANLIDLNEDRTVCDHTEDMQIMEAGLESLKWSEKSVEDMDCGNEG